MGQGASYLQGTAGALSEAHSHSRRSRHKCSHCRRCISGLQSSDTRCVRAAPSGAFGTFLKLFTYLALFIVGGVLLLRKFAPHILVDLNRQYNPWLLNTVGREISMGKFGQKRKPSANILQRYASALRSWSRPFRLRNLIPWSNSVPGQKKFSPGKKKLLGDIGGEGGHSGPPSAVGRNWILPWERSKESWQFRALPFWQVAAALRDCSNGSSRKQATSRLQPCGQPVVALICWTSCACPI